MVILWLNRTRNNRIFRKGWANKNHVSMCPELSSTLLQGIWSINKTFFQIFFQMKCYDEWGLKTIKTIWLIHTLCLRENNIDENSPLFLDVTTTFCRLPAATAQRYHSELLLFKKHPQYEVTTKIMMHNLNTPHQITDNLLSMS